jgi:periodic tryptophan protein 2
MKSNYKFSNLLGSVYSKGNLIFDVTGNSVLSPVSNRVSIYDLEKNNSKTIAHETQNDIQLIQLNHKNTLLLVVDQHAKAILINYQTQTIIARMTFKEQPSDIKFSPDDKLLAVAVGNKIQLWKTPGYKREFQPFVLEKTIGGHYDDITSITWKNDSTQFLTTSRDMTTRLYSLDDVGERVLMSGHTDVVLGAYFFKDSIYTVSRDGALYEYQYEKPSFNQKKGEDESKKQKLAKGERINKDSKNPKETVRKLRTARREYFNQNQKVVSCAFHKETGILAVGFDGGVFGIWELPDFINIQTLRYFIFNKHLPKQDRHCRH